MDVLDLDPQRVSLEFSPTERGEVMARLSAMGPVSITPGVTHDLVALGRHEFILMNEWDSLSLISRSAAGSAVLRRIADIDSGQGRAAVGM